MSFRFFLCSFQGASSAAASATAICRRALFPVGSAVERLPPGAQRIWLEDPSEPSKRYSEEISQYMIGLTVFRPAVLIEFLR